MSNHNSESEHSSPVKQEFRYSTEVLSWELEALSSGQSMKVAFDALPILNFDASNVAKLTESLHAMGKKNYKITAHEGYVIISKT